MYCRVGAVTYSRRLQFTAVQVSKLILLRRLPPPPHPVAHGWLAAESRRAFFLRFVSGSSVACVGGRLSAVSGDVRECFVSYRRISVVVQRFNSVLVNESFCSL